MLISIVGDVGSGKTLLATYIASKDSRPIYANYKMNIPNWHTLNPETLFELKTESLIVIDEAYIWLESRASGRTLNKYLSYILFQSRKRHLDIILTQQLLGTIDLRYRLLTDYEIYCFALENEFEYIILKKSGYVNYRPKRFIMPYHIAEKIFPLYNTFELVNPIDEEMMFKVSDDKTSIIDEIDSIVDDLLEKADAKEYTKGIISDICLRKSLPHGYVDLIYNALKARKLTTHSD